MISLTTMQGRVGLGDRPMKVSIAYVKGKDGSISYPTTQPEDLPESANGSSSQEQSGEQPQGDYAAQWEQYNQYWQQYAAWQQYYAAQPSATPATDAAAAQSSEAGTATAAAEWANRNNGKGQKSIFDGSLKELVQNKSSLDYQALNKEYLEKSEELYDAIEESRWWND
eukprot:TRINITY_DN8038_c0_g1_i1.p3 TRINITY_DN8038_c0_g1~~TRINITY_DN8038_c0_g1_i1.p3  ORF type:complete len:169 (+),score=73.41 TRINITY_DN8038_c0_g1_i1:690-1196(+)